MTLSDTTFNFVTDGIESAYEQAREAAGDKDVTVHGGAQTINQYLPPGCSTSSSCTWCRSSLLLVAELLGQRDDDAFGTAEVAHPPAVLDLRQLAHELGSAGLQPARTSSMPSTANMRRRMPNVFTAAFG